MNDTEIARVMIMYDITEDEYNFLLPTCKKHGVSVEDYLKERTFQRNEIEKEMNNE